jgi:hypothetical protein
MNERFNMETEILKKKKERNVRNEKLSESNKEHSRLDQTEGRILGSEIKIKELLHSARMKKMKKKRKNAHPLQEFWVTIKAPIQESTG